MTDSVKIAYKNKNVVVIVKPCGMPSQSDPSGDKDAMTATSELLSGAGEDGKLWLVHRLDRTVGGLIAFARSKKSAAELSRIVANGELEKKYIAVCHGSVRQGEYRDYLFKDSATGKAYVVKTERKGAKEAVLIADLLAEEEDVSLVSVSLITGRFHQIRAQLSAAGTPLVGDKKYGSRDLRANHPALFSRYLSFSLFGKKIKVSALPDIEEYPWNTFGKEIYKSLDKENEND